MEFKSQSLNSFIYGLESESWSIFSASRIAKEIPDLLYSLPFKQFSKASTNSGKRMSLKILILVIFPFDTSRCKVNSPKFYLNVFDSIKRKKICFSNGKRMFFFLPQSNLVSN